MVAVPQMSRDRGLRMQMRVGTRRAANFSHAQVRAGVPLLGDAGLAHVVAQLALVQWDCSLLFATKHRGNFQDRILLTCRLEFSRRQRRVNFEMDEAGCGRLVGLLSLHKGHAGSDPWF